MFVDGARDPPLHNYGEIYRVSLERLTSVRVISDGEKCHSKPVCFICFVLDTYLKMRLIAL